jgi:predicted nuclease of predicted toxin-antitoxin system
MKFLADECCDAALVNALRAETHDVLYAAESLRGAPDDELLARALSEQRILLTEDKDFGELIYRLRQATYGVVLLRFSIADRHLKIPRMHELPAQEIERIPGHMIVLEENKVRIRPLN